MSLKDPINKYDETIISFIHNKMTSEELIKIRTELLSQLEAGAKAIASMESLIRVLEDPPNLLPSEFIIRVRNVIKDYIDYQQQEVKGRKNEKRKY